MPESDANEPAPLISVVLSVLNGAEGAARALASVRAQTFAGWECLVVGGGAADESLVAHEVATQDPRVRVLGFATAGNAASARNAALAAARGEWVTYLDTNGAFEPDRLARIAERDGSGADVLVFRFDLDAAPAEAPPEPYTEQVGVAHRRRLTERTGSFDEGLPRDARAELWGRLASAGAVFAFVPVAHAPPQLPPLAPVPARPRSGPPRVLFASYHCSDDPASGAALCTHDLFDLLTARGWACAAFTGPQLDAPGAPVAERFRNKEGTTAHPGCAGGCSFTEFRYTAPAGYPGTVFAPDPPAARRAPSPDEARAFAARLDHEVRRFRPDVVLYYGGDPASAAVPQIARAAGAKPVFWLHNYAYPSAEPFRVCAAVVVPSEDSRTFYRARGLDPVVLPGPWNWDRARCAQVTPKYVTFVNPEPAKGVFWFARIAEVLNRLRPDIPLLVVEGRGDVTWLARCGLPLGAGGSLRRMRNVPDPRRFYRLSRLVLVPSLVRESLSRVAVEAMSNGIPVLGSGRGGMAEVLAAGGLQLAIPERFTPDTRTPPSAEEVAGWTAAITRLWDEPAAHAEASARAKTGAERTWHPDVLGPRWAAFLDSIASVSAA